PRFKPPAGDVISSGGDYGTREAKGYSASAAFRHSVRSAYEAQPISRRRAVSAATRDGTGQAAAAIKHEHESRVARNLAFARATAGRDVKSEDELFRGRPTDKGIYQQGKIEDVIRTINQLHTQTPINPAGDVKTPLEFATADAAKYQGQFGNLRP